MIGLATIITRAISTYLQPIDYRYTIFIPIGTNKNYKLYGCCYSAIYR